MGTRAVHIDIAPDYSTDKFLMVLRRFVSIRGYPSKLYSDNGSQLVAASAELKKVINDLDKKQLLEFGVMEGFEWKFSSADAPWQNGVSEALIKSVKKAITLIYQRFQTSIFYYNKERMNVMTKFMDMDRRFEICKVIG